MRTKARFPTVPPSHGHYESFYLKAAAPAGGRAVWIRYTLHRRPGRALTGALWLTYFDVERPAPIALKQQFSEPELSIPEGSYVRIDGGEIAPGHAGGRLAAGASRARWELRFSDRHEALRHLPREWMYERGLPRTKVLSPHPGAMFDGVLELDGERIELDGWPGMVGHNWGSEHAHAWVWLHGAGFGDDGVGFFDLAAGRIRLGPLRTPWLGNGMLAIDGEQHRLGGPSPRSVAIDARPGRCEFRARGAGIEVNGIATAPPKRTVAWSYSDPAGGSHDSLNCSIADLELILSRPGQPERRLRVERAAAYEFGTGERNHCIPIQPFADG